MFIIVTTVNKTQVRLNIYNILYYHTVSEGKSTFSNAITYTLVKLRDNHSERIIESPEEIDDRINSMFYVEEEEPQTNLFPSESN